MHLMGFIVTEIHCDGFRFAVSPSPSLTIGLFLSDVVNMRKSAQPSDGV
jgi:hypothetical protein